jgi:hypothetical protein
MRLLNILVIGALVLAASFVYKIKFDSTLQGERVARLRGELRQERDAIASMRAEWARLDNPARLQALAQRYLALRPIDPRQFDDFSRLPERPPVIVQPASADPVGAMVAPSDSSPADGLATGSVAPGR